MKKLLIFIPILLLVGAGCASQTAVKTGGTASTVGQKFTDQPYYKQAYLVSGDTLTTEAKSALAGFDMTRAPLPDGSILYIFNAKQPGYQDQQYTVKPGEKLYFIEKFLADDDPVKNEDKGMRDDQAVVVDAQGNVVQGPTDWTK